MIICEIIVHLLFIIQNNKEALLQGKVRYLHSHIFSATNYEIKCIIIMIIIIVTVFSRSTMFISFVL